MLSTSLQPWAWNWHCSLDKKARTWASSGIETYTSVLRFYYVLQYQRSLPLIGAGLRKALSSIVKSWVSKETVALTRPPRVIMDECILQRLSATLPFWQWWLTPMIDPSAFCLDSACYRREGRHLVSGWAGTSHVGQSNWRMWVKANGPRFRCEVDTLGSLEESSKSGG